MALILVTGSAGLVGSAVTDFMCSLGHEVHGIDNDERRRFFGDAGSTVPTMEWLQNKHRKSYVHHSMDIRDSIAIGVLMARFKPALVVHCAAQPSHDLAAKIPIKDWNVNASATIGLLEEARLTIPECVFVYMSTNKVYGDGPNRLSFVALEKRFDYANDDHADGINEQFGLDQVTHSLFGASKLAADIMVQEYGRYFGMRTCCLRGGCLTGPNHAGVALHGFLNYLVQCNVRGETYRIFGYHGKQVRDNLHALDVARFIYEFWASPRFGEVYNLGGGRPNSCSILEAFDLVSAVSGKPMISEYVAEPRKGDHICYISDLSKASEHYPNWNVSVPLQTIIEQIHEHYARTSR